MCLISRFTLTDSNIDDVDSILADSYLTMNADGMTVLNCDTGNLTKLMPESQRYFNAYDGLEIGFTYIIHQRFRTQGNVSEANLHPFKVSDRFFLFHNGTISTNMLAAYNCKHDSNSSDTAQLADGLTDYVNSLGITTLLDLDDIIDKNMLDHNILVVYDKFTHEWLDIFGRCHDGMMYYDDKHDIEVSNFYSFSFDYGLYLEDELDEDEETLRLFSLIN
jgi:hypothetical protein